MPRRGATPVVYSPQPEPRFAPNGYRLPDRIKEGEILTDMTQKQWRLGRAIGVGGFGEIYLGKSCHRRQLLFHKFTTMSPPHTAFQQNIIISSPFLGP